MKTSANIRLFFIMYKFPLCIYFLGLYEPSCTSVIFEGISEYGIALGIMLNEIEKATKN